MAGGKVREEYDEDKHVAGQSRDRPLPSFWSDIARDVFAGYFIAIRPCDGDERLVWIARAMSNHNTNLEVPNSVFIQYFCPTSCNVEA